MVQKLKKIEKKLNHVHFADRLYILLLFIFKRFSQNGGF